MSATSEATILPKAVPITTQIARSRTFHLKAKALNSFNIFIDGFLKYNINTKGILRIIKGFSR
jgi:hypothetical protein